MILESGHRRLKWVVYTLLLIDFAIYVYQDVESAAYTLGTDPTLLHTLRAYLTTIDLIAWFLLILLFELETGVLAGRLEKGNGWRWGIRGMRLLCYVAILHTTFGNVTLLHDYLTARPLPAAANLCGYTDGTWSYLENRGYTTIDAENCTEMGIGLQFFAIDPEPVVTDRAGLAEARILGWTDLIENMAWLLIVLGNEVVVRLQAAGDRRSAALTFIGRLKALLYTLILGIAIYWLSKEQLLYFWDEVLWVGGFLMIEGNLREYRARLRVSQDRR